VPTAADPPILRDPALAHFSTGFSSGRTSRSSTLSTPPRVGINNAEFRAEMDRIWKEAEDRNAAENQAASFEDVPL